MSNLVKANSFHLKTLANSNPNLAAQIIKLGNPAIIKSIVEIFINLNKKTIPISKTEQRFILSKLAVVKTIISKGVSIEKKRKIMAKHLSIIQKGIKIALSFLRSFLDDD